MNHINTWRPVGHSEAAVSNYSSYRLILWSAVFFRGHFDGQFTLALWRRRREAFCHFIAATSRRESTGEASTCIYPGRAALDARDF